MFGNTGRRFERRERLGNVDLDLRLRIERSADRMLRDLMVRARPADLMGEVEALQAKVEKAAKL